MPARPGKSVRKAPTAEPPTASPRERFILPALILITLVVFWPVQQHGFLVLDDDAYVYRNPHVMTGLTAANVFWALTSTQVFNWHPVTWMSHMLDVSIYGLDPAGHHRTNLLFHLANVLLLYWALRKITGGAWCSAFVAALFAIHPLHVEPVVWIAERKELACTFFMLATIVAYARYAKKPAVIAYVPAVLFFALGLMSKPMIVSLPLLLLLLDYWPFGRFGAAGVSTGKLVAEKLPFMVLAAASSIVTFAAQKSGGAVAAFSGFPLSLRLENAVLSYARYIGKMIVPAGLALPYPYPDGGIRTWQLLGASFVFALLTFAAVRWAGRLPYLFTGWSWYVVSLVPAIGVIQVGGQAIADRYTYIPLIGLFIVVAWGGADLIKRIEARYRRMGGNVAAVRPAMAAQAAIVILLLAIVTRVQVGFWSDGITLFSHAIAVTGDNYLAHNELGMAFSEGGDRVRAASEFRKSIDLAPDYSLSHYNLGGILYEEGRANEAISEYEKAIKIAPGFYRTYHNLGFILIKQGKVDQAEAVYRKAVSLEPESGESHWNLALIQYSKGRYAEAWAETRLSEQCGFRPPRQFLDALSAQMPNPNPSVK